MFAVLIDFGAVEEDMPTVFDLFPTMNAFSFRLVYFMQAVFVPEPTSAYVLVDAGLFGTELVDDFSGDAIIELIESTTECSTSTNLAMPIPPSNIKTSLFEVLPRHIPEVNAGFTFLVDNKVVLDAVTIIGQILNEHAHRAIELIVLSVRIQASLLSRPYIKSLGSVVLRILKMQRRNIVVDELFDNKSNSTSGVLVLSHDPSQVCNPKVENV